MAFPRAFTADDVDVGKVARTQETACDGVSRQMICKGKRLKGRRDILTYSRHLALHCAISARSFAIVADGERGGAIEKAEGQY